MGVRRRDVLAAGLGVAGLPLAARIALADEPSPAGATPPPARPPQAAPQPTAQPVPEQQPAITPAPPQPAAAPAPPPAPPPFGLEQVRAAAKALAAKPFSDERRPLADPLRNLSYDQYRDVRFKPDRALWRGQGLFELQLFHRGSIYDRQVKISTVEGGKVTELTYSRDLFDFGANKIDPAILTPELGFAGFRVHFPLNKPSYADEAAVFLGASYFRFVGRGQIYGLSTRALAIDTASPKGEEFPFFREFWIEKPAPDADVIVLYALVDSPSVAGAFKFTLRPNTVSGIEVDMQLTARNDIGKLGVAPLTSMFFHGQTGRRFPEDYRPEVHDSDGLLLNTGSGEWVWRPLVNRAELRVSAFMDKQPHGFGLLQRARRPEVYDDMEALYFQRPSYWVEPLADWGAGHVELVEIPTDSEIHDNIVAFWVPEAPLKAGASFSTVYRVSAQLEKPERPPGGRVLETRIGSAQTAASPGVPQRDRLFVIDFGDGDLPQLWAEQPIEAVISASTGEVGKVTVRKTEDSRWRVVFPFKPDNRKPSDLRCYLRLRHDVLTETWSYLWTA